VCWMAPPNVRMKWDPGPPTTLESNSFMGEPFAGLLRYKPSTSIASLAMKESKPNCQKICPAEPLQVWTSSGVPELVLPPRTPMHMLLLVPFFNCPAYMGHCCANEL